MGLDPSASDKNGQYRTGMGLAPSPISSLGRFRGWGKAGLRNSGGCPEQLGWIRAGGPRLKAAIISVFARVPTSPGSNCAGELLIARATARFGTFNLCVGVPGTAITDGLCMRFILCVNSCFVDRSSSVAGSAVLALPRISSATSPLTVRARVKLRNPINPRLVCNKLLQRSVLMTYLAWRHLKRAIPQILDVHMVLPSYLPSS
jgi:hypothetical protein